MLQNSDKTTILMLHIHLQQKFPTTSTKTQTISTKNDVFAIMQKIFKQIINLRHIELQQNSSTMLTKIANDYNKNSCLQQ